MAASTSDQAPALTRPRRRHAADGPQVAVSPPPAAPVPDLGTPGRAAMDASTPDTPASGTPAPHHPAPGRPTLGTPGPGTTPGIPAGGERPADLEALTDQMLAQLAAAETGRALPDVDSVPGGKWGLLIAGMAVVTGVLVAVAALAGSLLG